MRRSPAHKSLCSHIRSPPWRGARHGAASSPRGLCVSPLLPAGEPVAVWKSMDEGSLHSPRQHRWHGCHHVGFDLLSTFLPLFGRWPRRWSTAIKATDRWGRYGDGQGTRVKNGVCSLCSLTSGISLLCVALEASLCACAAAAARAPPAWIFARCCVSASCPGWHLHGSAHWWSLGSAGNWTLSLGQNARCAVCPKSWISSGWTELVRNILNVQY